MVVKVQGGGWNLWKDGGRNQWEIRLRGRMCDGVEIDRPQGPQVRPGQRQVPRGLDYRGRTLVLYRGDGGYPEE